MKLPFLLLFLCGIVVGGCKKKANPAPAPVTSMTYTDATGRQSAITTYHTALITPPPSTSGQERRILQLQVTLPDASTLELLYYYVGAGFPTTPGPVALDELVQVLNYSTGSGGYGYYGSVRNVGALTVNTVSPAVFSGTYDGTLGPNGQQTVHLEFQNISL